MEVQAISGISTVNSNISHSMNDSADMRDSMRPSTVCSNISMIDSTLEGNDQYSNTSSSETQNDENINACSSSSSATRNDSSYHVPMTPNDPSNLSNQINLGFNAKVSG